ncbi:hypothetical protein L2E82_00438 [Cichorium intybus]|uniref:Uncharacterized protein n=1 Tax=Cichorium intybus TaxID=13427 RepID=A0ACB9GX40_CICIN|nr:hypothetical protein L2E82_00438 [Cichorium intybus]
MDRDFFMNAGLQFEQSSQPPWKLMTLMPEMNFPGEQASADGVTRPNWEKPDQYSHFNTGVSSMVSSPVSNSAVSNDIVAVRELIGKFHDGYPAAMTTPPPYSSTNTQLNSSPPKMDDNKNSEDINMKLSRLSGSAANSNEESSVSEQIPSGELGFKNQKDSNSRKRKGVSSKGIGSTAKKEENAADDSNTKRLKKPEQEIGDTKQVEAPKDYIHVRARRGQATDSHSLAERVRREKIGERMKLLQNLVPNCDKVTGKALMLDEIINYVQSLQRQVEFLSMKLATVNPCLDGDNLQSNGDLSQSTQQVQSSTSNFHHQNPQVLFNRSTPMTQSVHQLPEPFLQYPGFGQDDLQSIVQMGFGEGLDLDTPFFHAPLDQPSSMKMEL